MVKTEWRSRGVKFVSVESQITCYGHETGNCNYKYPHRIGSKLCAFHKDNAACVSCANGYCEYHRYDDGYDPRQEALTAYERNM